MDMRHRASMLIFVDTVSESYCNLHSTPMPTPVTAPFLPLQRGRKHHIDFVSQDAWEEKCLCSAPPKLGKEWWWQDGPSGSLLAA